MNHSSPLPAVAEEINPILVGAELPHVTLRAGDGSSFSLNAAVAGQPTVLMFYRGGWCPYCDMHFSRLHQIEDELTGLGYQIIAVSPDRPEFLSRTKEKHQFSCVLASDSQMSAAMALGIAYRVDEEDVARYEEYGIDLEGAAGESHHLLPVPAVFVLNTAGVIQFSYVNPNYKVRLDPDVLLAAARSALKDREV